MNCKKIIFLLFIIFILALIPKYALAANIPVSSISLDSKIQIKLNEKIKLSPKIIPSNATNKTITWSSSNTKVATISTNGTVTAKGLGKTIILAKTSNLKIASCVLSVYQPAERIKLNTNSIQIAVGSSYKLSAKIYPSTTTYKTLTWTSSNTKVATVNSIGNIKAISPGKSTITVKTTNGKRDYLYLTVYQPAKSLKMNRTTLTLEVGKSFTLSATISPTNTTYKTLTWTSSNTNIVSVNSKGQITAKSSGQATITAKTTNGKRAYCSVVVPKQDVYDVILFWGQSNMVGSCYTTKETRFIPTNTTSVNSFSKLSGIDADILKQNTAYKNVIKITQKPNTVFEYMYSNNSLVEITAGRQQYGENLKYINNYTLQKQKIATSETTLSASLGVNMIPEFCRAYYSATGHKVVAVFAAYGGVQIQEFLPQNDIDNKSKSNRHLYEALKIKYNAAIKYLTSHNYKIGKKSYVVCQGCADVIAGTSTSEYVRKFTKVHNNLKRDLGITNGAIIETSGTSGLRIMSQINRIHNAQEQLIRQNPNIVLGSSYSYDRYVSTRADYANCKTAVTYDTNGRRLSYDEALKRSRYSVDDSINALTKKQDNLIHFTSAALSQMGRSAAKQLAKVNK